MHDDLIGVWILRSFVLEEVETGQRTEPFGSNPQGVIMLHPGGRMAALLTPADRSAPVTEAAQAAAFQTLIAYSGHYRLEPPDRFVTSVDIAWFQSWVGTDQVRQYKLRGDELDIITTPNRLPRAGGADALVIGVLTWVRETPPLDEGRPSVGHKSLSERSSRIPSAS